MLSMDARAMHAVKTHRCTVLEMVALISVERMVPPGRVPEETVTPVAVVKWPIEAVIIAVVIARPSRDPNPAMVTGTTRNQTAAVIGRSNLLGIRELLSEPTSGT
jgi:hypothetical protein